MSTNQNEMTLTQDYVRKGMRVRSAGTALGLFVRRARPRLSGDARTHRAARGKQLRIPAGCCRKPRQTFRSMRRPPDERWPAS